MTGFPFKKGNFFKKEQRRGNMKSRAKRACDWSLASINREMLRIARNHQRLEERRKNSYLELSERIWPCWDLDLRLLASRTMRQWIYIALRHSDFGTLLLRPWEPNIVYIPCSAQSWHFLLCRLSSQLTTDPRFPQMLGNSSSSTLCQGAQSVCWG